MEQFIYRKKAAKFAFLLQKEVNCHRPEKLAKKLHNDTTQNVDNFLIKLLQQVWLLGPSEKKIWKSVFWPCFLWGGSDSAPIPYLIFIQHIVKGYQKLSMVALCWFCIGKTVSVRWKITMFTYRPTTSLYCTLVKYRINTT